MKTFADDTAGLMDALGISKAHILGISMGGMIAQEFVLNYPAKVAKLVLCSTGDKWCFSHEISRIMLAVGKSSPEELTRMIFFSQTGQRFSQRCSQTTTFPCHLFHR
jgi:pimeloyl-ACP methyl ester carboxylesterase